MAQKFTPHPDQKYRYYTVNFQRQGQSSNSDFTKWDDHVKFYTSSELTNWCKVSANHLHGTAILWSGWKRHLLWQNAVEKSYSLLLLLIQLLASLVHDIFQVNSMDLQHLHHVVNRVNGSTATHIASVQFPIQVVTRESAWPNNSIHKCLQRQFDKHW